MKWIIIGVWPNLPIVGRDNHRAGVVNKSIFQQPSVPIHSNSRVKGLNCVKLRRNDDFSSGVDESPFSFIDDAPTPIVANTEISGSHSFGEFLDALKFG